MARPLLLAAAMLAASCGGPEDPDKPATIPLYAGYAFETLVDLGPRVRPADIVALPSGELLVIGLNGQLFLYDPAAEGTGAAALHGPVQTTADTMDHVAIAAHPEFGDGEHDVIYLWRNELTELWRWHVDLDPFEVSDGEMLMRFSDEPTDGHSGGDLLFWSGETSWPTLYLTIGDGQATSGQDDSTAFGALVAFKEANDGTLVPGLPQATYENPYVAAIGLRNPWRLGDCGPAICMADVGRDDVEELNAYAGTPTNFGWSGAEGAVGKPGLQDPVWEYNHRQWDLVSEDADNSGNLDVMKVVWTSSKLSDDVFSPALAGRVLVGDHYDGWIRALPVDERGQPQGPGDHVAHQRYVSSIVEAADGRVYATDLSGTIRRMVLRADYPMADEPGAKLSDSAYYDPSYPSWGFDVRHPLWSNGAGKDRLLVLPPGAKVDNSNPDHWVFPVGARLYKTFFVNDDPIETRVLEKRDRGWVTGTYVYASDGEAYFTDGYNLTVPTAEGPYLVPSVASCEECHAGSRGKDFPVGFEPFQLGPDGLAAVQDALLVPLLNAPNVAGDDLDATVRGHLHGNCAYCHNPEGRVMDLVSLPLDFRFSTPTIDMRLVNQEVKYLNQPMSPTLVAPGRPETSALVGVLDEGLMPPVGLWQIDETFQSDLVKWIGRMNPDDFAAP